MKRLEVTTNNETIVEYHASSDIATKRLASLLEKYEVVSFGMSEVVKSEEPYADINDSGVDQ